MRDRLADLDAELTDLEARLADPQLLADQRRLTQETRRYKELETVVRRWRRLQEREADLAAARELAADAPPRPPTGNCCRRRSRRPRRSWRR